MRIATRRIIYAGFITVFLVAAPVILLYTLGFRYDFKKHTFLQTGGLFLYVQNPIQTKIYLNDAFAAETGLLKKEIQIQNLLPNDYRIRAEKDGYFSWEKTLPVVSRKTAFAEHIALFRKPVPELIARGIVEKISMSPKNNYLAYVAWESDALEFWLINLKTQETRLLSRLPQAAFSAGMSDEWAKWSPNEENFLFSAIEKKTQTKHYFIVDLASSSVTTELSSVTDIHFTNVSRSLVNDALLYGFAPKNIYRINLVEDSSIPLLPPREKDAAIETFGVMTGMLLWTEKTPSENFLWRKKIDGGEPERLLTLPAGDYRIVEPENPDILELINLKNGELLVVRQKNWSLDIKNNAREALWNASNDALLFYNDFELWSYRADANDAELLSRYSREIEKALWIPKTEYVVFSFSDELSIIELDGRDRRNFYTILEKIPVRDFAMGDESKIFVSATIGGVPGLYRIPL